jgi:hypothetical protein
MCQSLRLVSLLIGQDGFEDLLIRMPDSFFSLMPETKAWVWDEILNMVNQGIEDPATLAKVAEQLIKGEPVDVPLLPAGGAGQLNPGPPYLQDGAGLACSDSDDYSIQKFKELTKEHGDEPVFEVSL